MATHRGFLARADRAALLDRYWPALSSNAWEDACRRRLPRLGKRTALARLGPWTPASRWWHGPKPEWDVVSASGSGDRLLLGDVKWSARPFTRSMIDRETRRLAAREMPDLSGNVDDTEILRVLFVPALASGAPVRLNGVRVVDAAAVMT